MKETDEQRDVAMADLRRALEHAFGTASDRYTLIRIDDLVEGEPAGVAYNLAEKCMLVLVDDTGRRHSGFDGLLGLERNDGIAKLAGSLTEFFRTSVAPESLQVRGWGGSGAEFAVYDFVLTDGPSTLKY